MLLLLFLGFFCTSALAATSTTQGGWVVATSSTIPSWPHQTFVTEPELKAPVFNISGHSSSSDYIFFAPQAGNYPGAMIITPEGELVWASEPDSFVNLTPLDFEGDPSLMYWNGTSIGDLEAYGSMLVFDKNYKEARNVKLIDPDLGTEWPSYADVHEGYYTGRGTMLFTAVNKTGPYDLQEFGGPEHGWVWDCLVYEVDVDTNEVLFRWKAVDHLDRIPFTDSRALPLTGRTGNGTNLAPWDVYHLNSITTYDGGFIVSMRHMSTAYHINRAGEVVWQIHGTTEPVQAVQDFQMGDDTWFSWQHDIRVAHATKSSLRLHLHDNANWTPTGGNTSFGLVLNVDLDKMSVTKEIRLSDVKDPVMTFAGGAMARLGSHWWMDYGYVPKMKEFNENGQCIYTLQFGEPLEDNTYRAYRSPWKGYPTIKPKVVSKDMSTDKAKKTRIYVSWNGATEVRMWNILAGNDKKRLSSVATVAKNGFETVVDITGEHTFVQAVPIGYYRTELLRSSHVVTVRKH